MLKPLADRIIVKATTAEEMTKGGIVLPDSAKDAIVRMVGGLQPQ